MFPLSETVRFEEAGRGHAHPGSPRALSSAISRVSDQYHRTVFQLRWWIHSLCFFQCGTSTCPGLVLTSQSLLWLHLTEERLSRLLSLEEAGSYSHSISCLGYKRVARTHRGCMLFSSGATKQFTQAVVTLSFEVHWQNFLFFCGDLNLNWTRAYYYYFFFFFTFLKTLDYLSSRVSQGEARGQWRRRTDLTSPPRRNGHCKAWLRRSVVDILAAQFPPLQFLLPADRQHFQAGGGELPAGR